LESRIPYDWRLLPTISDNGRPILAPEGVRAALREQGFIEPQRIYYTGGIYTALARTPHGGERSLRVDATTGLVIHRHGDHHHIGDRAPIVLDEPLVPRKRIGRYIDRSAIDEPVLLSFHKVRSELEGLGYTDCDEAGFDDGLYRIQARNRKGDLVRLMVDGYTNEIIAERVVASFDDPWIDEPRNARIEWIKRRLRRDEYRDIREIRLDGRQYIVEAEDATGDEVRLVVDARSGHIIDKDYVG
jgi:hypothetical protein